MGLAHRRIGLARPTGRAWKRRDSTDTKDGRPGRTAVVLLERGASADGDGLRLDVEQARHGEISLARVVGEGQDAGTVLDLGQLFVPVAASGRQSQSARRARVAGG